LGKKVHLVGWEIQYICIYLHFAPALKLLKRSWFVSLWLAVGKDKIVPAFINKDVHMPAGEV
jgi:hypothetical protein